MKRTYVAYVAFIVLMVAGGVLLTRLLTSGPFDRALSMLGKGEGEYRKARTMLALSSGDPVAELVSYCADPKTADRARIHGLRILHDLARQHAEPIPGVPLVGLLAHSPPAVQSEVLKTLEAMRSTDGMETVAGLFHSSSDSSVVRQSYATMRAVMRLLIDSLETAARVGNDTMVRRLLSAGAPLVGSKGVLYRRAAEYYRGKGDTAQAGQWASRCGMMADWWMAGPFENQGNDALERNFGPEGKTPSKSEVFAVRKDAPAGWHPVHYTDGLGFVDFNNMYDGCCSVAYLFAYVCVPTQRDALLLTGHLEPARAWLNDSLVYSSTYYGPAFGDDWCTRVRLRAGVNRLLVKSVQNLSGWRVAVRLTDMRGEAMPDVVVSLQPTASAAE